MVRSYSIVWSPILIIAAMLLFSCEPSPNQPTIESDFQPSALPIIELKSSQETEPMPSPVPATRIYLELTFQIPPTASVTPTLEPSPAPTREPCSPADEGPFAGIDPRGQTILWWHAYSSEGDLAAIVFNFNHTNECEIQVDIQYQGSYTAIHDKMFSALEKGNIPDLLVGYQNDQAAYQKVDGLVNLDPYIQDSIWGLSGEEQADFYPSFWNQSIHPAYGNQWMGFALNRSMELMFYNTSRAKELGFENPPATPDEFEQQACAAAHANGVGGYLLRISASSVAAWIFVKWITSPDIQALWVKVSSYYPTRLSTAGRLQRYQAKNPIWKSGYDLLPFGMFEPQLISYDLVRDQVQKTFDKIMQGDGSNIQALLIRLTEKANQLQSDTIK